MESTTWGDSSGTPQNRELTEQELRIVSLVVAGYSTGDLARKLGLSERTARRHLTRICDKLGACDRFELALLALHRGLVEPAKLVATRTGSC
jgi:DNA-binding NarL/FixJ family response regulator